MSDEYFSHQRVVARRALVEFQRLGSRARLIVADGIAAVLGTFMEHREFERRGVLRERAAARAGGGAVARCERRKRKRAKKGDV